MTTDKEQAQLKDLTRKAHEACQELKSVLREARAAKQDIEAAARVTVSTHLAPIVAQNIRELGEATSAAIDEAMEKVDQRFEVVVDIMLGEDTHSKRTGRLSLAQMAENRKAMKRGEELPHDLEPT